jgi:hypothetical protein
MDLLPLPPTTLPLTPSHSLLSSGTLQGEALLCSGYLAGDDDAQKQAHTTRASMALAASWGAITDGRSGAYFGAEMEGTSGRPRASMGASSSRLSVGADGGNNGQISMDEDLMLTGSIAFSASVALDQSQARLGLAGERSRISVAASQHHQRHLQNLAAQLGEQVGLPRAGGGKEGRRGDRKERRRDKKEAPQLISCHRHCLSFAHPFNPSLKPSSTHTGRWELSPEHCRSQGAAHDAGLPGLSAAAAHACHHALAASPGPARCPACH